MMIRYRPPEKDEAARLYARFVARTGLQPRTGETPQVFADRVRDAGVLQAATVTTITDAYMEARYGGITRARERLREAVAAIR
jgi:Tfp pilus assembly protein FimV